MQHGLHRRFINTPAPRQQTAAKRRALAHGRQLTAAELRQSSFPAAHKACAVQANHCCRDVHTHYGAFNGNNAHLRRLPPPNTHTHIPGSSPHLDHGQRTQLTHSVVPPGLPVQPTRSCVGRCVASPTGRHSSASQGQQTEKEEWWLCHCVTVVLWYNLTGVQGVSCHAHRPGLNPSPACLPAAPVFLPTRTSSICFTAGRCLPRARQAL